VKYTAEDVKKLREQLKEKGARYTAEDVQRMKEELYKEPEDKYVFTPPPAVDTDSGLPKSTVQKLKTTKVSFMDAMGKMQQELGVQPRTITPEKTSAEAKKLRTGKEKQNKPKKINPLEDLKSIGSKIVQGAVEIPRGLTNINELIQDFLIKQRKVSPFALLTGKKEGVLSKVAPKQEQYEKDLAMYDEAVKKIGSAVDQSKVGKGSEFIGDVMRSMPKMSLNFIPGVGQLLFAASTAGDYAEQAKQQGATKKQQLLYGALGGVAEVTLNKVLGIIPRMKSILSGEAAKSGVLGKQIIKSALSESVEEGAIDPVMGFAEKFIYNPDKKWVGPDGVVDFGQMGYDAAAGAAMSLLFSALGMPANYYSKKVADAYVKRGRELSQDELNLLKKLYKNDIETHSQQTEQQTKQPKILQLPAAKPTLALPEATTIMQGPVPVTAEERAALKRPVTTPKATQRRQDIQDRLRQIQEIKGAQIPSLPEETVIPPTVPEQYRRETPKTVTKGEAERTGIVKLKTPEQAKAAKLAEPEKIRQMDEKLSQAAKPEQKRPEKFKQVSGKKISKFKRSLEKAPVTEKIRNMLSDEEFLYETRSNKKDAETAYARVERDVDGEMNRLLQDTGKPTESAVDSIEIYAVADKLIRDGRIDDAKAFVTQVRLRVTSTAQALQALAVRDKLSPGGVLITATKMLEESAPKETVKKARTEAKEVSEKVKDINEKAVADILNKLDMGGKDIYANRQELLNMHKARLQEFSEANGYTADKEGTRAFEVVERLRRQDEAAKEIASALGADVIFIRPTSEKNNRFDGATFNGTIFINARATNPAHVVLGHEIMERLAAESPEAFNEFVGTFKNELDATKAAQYRKELAEATQKQLGRELTDADFYREAAGDYSGEMFNNPDMIAKVVKQAPNVAEKIVRIIRNMIAKLKAVVNRSYQVERYVRDAEKVRDAYLKAMGKFAPKLKAPEGTAYSVKRGKTEKFQTKLDRIIRKTANESGVNLKKLIAQHYTETEIAGKTLAQKLTENTGLTAEEAEYLSKQIQDRVREMTEAKKKAYLDSLFKKRTTPSRRKELADRVIELSNMGALGETQYAEILYDKYGIPQLSAEEAQSIVKQAEQIQKIKNVFNRQAAINKMMAEIRSKIPAGAAGKVRAYTLINTLLNPKTIGSRNVMGNISQAIAQRVDRYVMSAIDWTKSAVTGKERKITWRTNRGVIGMYKQFFSDIKTGGASGWEGYSPYGTVSEFKTATQQFRGKHNPLTYLEKALGASLGGAGDYPFYMKAVLDSIGEQSVLRAMNEGYRGKDLKVKAKEYADEIVNSALNVSDYAREALDKANRTGEKATFRDPNIVSTVLKEVHDALNIVGFGEAKRTYAGKVKSKQYGLGDLVVFFSQTPGSLLNIGFEYSPAGILKSVYYIGKGIHDSRKGAGGYNTEKIINGITKAVGGTLFLSGLGYFLTLKGAMTGKGEDDEEARQFLEENGKRSYSVNMTAVFRWFMNGFVEEELNPQDGDKWFTYDWFAPFSFNIGLGSNVAQSAKKESLKTGQTLKETFPNVMWKASLETLYDDNTVSNLLMPFRGYEPMSSLKQTFINSVSRFVPLGSILNMVRQITDNAARSTKSSDVRIQVMNIIKNRIPGLSKTLPEIITTTGSTKELYQGGTNNFLNVVLNPGFIKQYKETPGTKLLIDLYESTGKTTQFPRKARKSISVYGQTIELTDAQQAELQKYIGYSTMLTVNALTEQRAFNRLSDEEKVEAIYTVLNEIGNNGEEHMARVLGIKKPPPKLKGFKETEKPKFKAVKP